MDLGTAIGVAVVLGGAGVTLYSRLRGRKIGPLSERIEKVEGDVQELKKEVKANTKEIVILLEQNKAVSLRFDDLREYLDRQFSLLRENLKTRKRFEIYRGDDDGT